MNTAVAIMFQKTYLDTCMYLINLQESRISELCVDYESIPLVPQEMSSILHRE